VRCAVPCCDALRLAATFGWPCLLRHPACDVESSALYVAHGPCNHTASVVTWTHTRLSDVVWLALTCNYDACGDAAAFLKLPCVKGNYPFPQEEGAERLFVLQPRG
jgi:hypothetical protein